VRVRKVEAHLLPEVVADAVAQGNPPDIAEYYAMSIQAALDTRGGDGDPLFVPVERAIAGRAKVLGEPVVIDDLVPAVREHYRVGGELVSMPTFVSTNILYGNKAVLERAGLERMPATWEELTAACAAITGQADGPAHGVSWPNYGWLFHMELAGQGALLSSNGNGRAGRSTRVYLDSPEMLNYVRWWKKLYDRGYYLATEEFHYVTVMEAFMRQEIAFAVSTTAVGGFVKEMATAGGIELVAGQLPRSSELRSPGGVPGGGSFFLAAGLPKDKEDGALAFLQHQLNPEHAMARMFDDSSPMTSLPVTQAAYRRAMADDWAEPCPGFRIAAQQVASAQRTPAAAGAVLGNLAGINLAITEAMEDVLLREADPVRRFRAATEEAQLALDRHNAPALAYPPVTPDVLRAG
jgi:sn-glycerol 3-phosphate transport system substrate-binding protein